MGLINGGASYTRFVVNEEIPKDFHTVATSRLERFAFKEINPKKHEEISIGWVAYDNPTNARVTIEKAFFGDYSVLGIRVDKKTISSILYKAELSQALRVLRQELKGKKPTTQRVSELREELRTKMLEAIAPQVAVYEMVWNFQSGTVFFSSQSRKAVDMFTELFKDTFELTLNEMDIVELTENYLETEKNDVVFEDLYPSHFRD